MNVNTHEELKGKIWEIANRLRGPYRPPQYERVMLPMTVGPSRSTQGGSG